MKIRTVVPVVLAGVALAAGAASANPAYWREHGLLLEVSADPRDGTDYVQTNPTHATRLELVALQAPVHLRRITVRFSDGRTFSQATSTIRPGERVMLQLPRRAGIIQGVDLEYGPQIVDRTPARLQIIPHEDGSYPQPSRHRDHRDYRRYSTPYDRAYPAPERPRYRGPYDAPYDRAPYHTAPYDRAPRDDVQPYDRAPHDGPSPYAPSGPTYIIEPRSGWSGTIEGNFRF